MSSEDFLLNAKKLAMSMQSDDKRTRKAAFVELEKLVSSEAAVEQDLNALFVETQVYALNGFRDKTEVVRQQAIKFMSFLIIEKLPLNDFYLTYIVPVLVERIGTPEVTEESEEIRLQLVQFLQAIILKYSNTPQLKPFLGDSVIILAETVKDKFPAIKELSCKCIIDLSFGLPKDFHMQAETLIKPVVSCLTHQRYKVRVEAINAIGEIIMHSSYKGLDEAVGPLAEKLFDQIPVVRRTVAKVAARWLLEYRDRYSFFHKIIPLLLTGLNDEVEETRIEAQKLWEKVGLQYKMENEHDLKDQIDFLLENPKFYPPHLKRPNLGCRVLIQRNVGKLTKALSYELTSWQEDIRFRCSQLLCSLALHAEDGITQHLQDLLIAMYSAARDEDQRVTANIGQASEIMGLFVPRSTWYKLVLPVIEGGPHFGHLSVLCGFIKGTSKDYITEHLEDITKFLADDSVCYTRKKNIQRELIKCVDAVSAKFGQKSGTDVCYHVFKVVVALTALRDEENTHIDVSLFNKYAALFGFASADSLWSAFTGRLLSEIHQDPKSWTVVTPQRCIFETILLNSNQSFGENLDAVSLILKETLDIEADAESRLKTFWALAAAFDRKSIIFERSTDSSEFFACLITFVFVPSLVWHAGLTAEAIRTMAASCLLCALTPLEGKDLFSNENMVKAMCDKLVPLLLSLMEDASYKSRQLAMECLTELKGYANQHGIWDCELLIKTYPEILKRLDDPTDKVRITALTILPRIFDQCPSYFKESNFQAHHELIVDTLLIHFDDDDEVIYNLVFECLKVAALIDPLLVKEKVIKHKPLLCNQEGCDRFLKYLEQTQL